MHGTVCPRLGLAAAPRRLCACARVLLLRRACCVPALGPCCCAVLPLALGLFCSCAGARLRLGLIQLSELVGELVSTLTCFKTGKALCHTGLDTFSGMSGEVHVRGQVGVRRTCTRAGTRRGVVQGGMRSRFTKIWPIAIRALPLRRESGEVRVHGPALARRACTSAGQVRGVVQGG